MLIQCTIKNFLSFRDEVTFSMKKGLQRKHSNHIIHPTGFDNIDLVKAGIIYGANASGKSNFVKALKFIQNFVIEGSSTDNFINRKPFILDKESSEKISEFTFNFCFNGRSYSYGISFDYEQIKHEWLYEILKTTEKKLFERTFSPEDGSDISFGTWINNITKEEQQFLKFIAKATPKNQPFLKESNDRQVNEFSDAYKWFRNSLHIIFPQSKFTLGRILFDEESSTIEQSIIDLLSDFGTGIVDFELRKYEPDNLFSSEKINEFERNIDDKNFAELIDTAHKGKIFIKRNEKTKLLEALILYLKHRGNFSDHEYVRIHPEDESDGTIRLLDLLPILVANNDETDVFIVDEFDRSIHPNLSYKFLELFLCNKNTNSQLVATTHEENLLDLDLLRRDEIWFIEKDYQGSSNLYSLEEFQPRYDKNIRNGYLNGRFGAIPILRTPRFCEES